MSSKDNPTNGPETSAPAQVSPVDLATKTANVPVAQIRIPTVPTNQRPTLVTTNRPVVGGGASSAIRPVSSTVSSKVSPSLTMIPSSKVTVVPASLTSRPILAQPAPSRPATPILRGVTPVTLRAPSIRLIQQPAQSKVQGAARVPMAAVSFRPTGPLVTTARPALSPTGSTAVTKTIVTQNPAGVFKPITTQVTVSGQAVALKPSSSTGSLPVRVPSGQRVTMVSTTQTSHIQVPLVPGAVGPPKSRVAVPSAGGAVKVVSGANLSMVTVAPVQTPPARTIQLPNSGPTKPGGSNTTNIPVARVVPQQSTRDSSVGVTTGYVVAGAFVPGGNQASPVNLTMTRATVPAMAIPNFNQTTLMYDRESQNSVTITTLPAGEGGHTSQATPATITPARITPMAATETDKTVPGSPRPSILRKRPDTEAVTPIKGTAILTSPSSPPRPDSSGSSTISATSSLPVLSGDEQPAQQAPASIEPSPRKKPRKQVLPPRETNTNISPEWAAVKREIGVRDRLEWKTRPEADWEGKVRNWNMETGGQEVGWDQEQDMVQDQADDEDEMSTDEERDKQTGSLIRGAPTATLLNSYRHTWKSRHNHFLRYSDVKSKDEKRPTVNELANQKFVLQKINGWKIYHLSAGMEDIVDMENELSDKLEDFAQRIEDGANKDVAKELVKVQELIKANIQRSKVIQDQVSEAKDNSQSIFEHKPKIQDIILKYQSKRDRTGRGRRDT